MKIQFLYLWLLLYEAVFHSNPNNIGSVYGGIKLSTRYKKEVLILKKVSNLTPPLEGLLRGPRRLENTTPDNDRN